MEKWTTLEPVKLYAGGVLPTQSSRKPKVPQNPNLRARYVGPLPVDIHILVISFLPVTSLSTYALASRSLAGLLHDERIWRRKCDVLRLQDAATSMLLANIENPSIDSNLRPNPPPELEVQALEEDEFGDFASAPLAATLSSNGFNEVPESPYGSEAKTPFTVSEFNDISSSVNPVLRNRYIHAHRLLRELARRLLNIAPHLLLTALFPPPHTPSLRQRAQTLALLMRFLSAPIQPVLNWPELRTLLSSAIDRFQAGVLAAFEAADAQSDEKLMTEAAYSSWEAFGAEGELSVRGYIRAEWELGRVWVEKLEIFYEGSQWDPSRNFTANDALAFEAMDDFMNYVVGALTKHGAQAVRVFPHDSQVLFLFADRLANEVIGEYIAPLLSRARGLKNPELFLKAVAASFVQSWRLVAALLDVSCTTFPINQNQGAPPGRPQSPANYRKNSAPNTNGVSHTTAALTYTQAEDVIFRMFESNMDEYLDEEVDHLKLTLENLCGEWDRNTSTLSAETQFLTSSNPAQMKRTVLASFTDLMLLPVTIVPRSIGAVGAIVQTGGSAAVQGISMLNPGRWIGTNVPSNAENGRQEGYTSAAEMKGALVEKGTVVFQTIHQDGDDEDDLTVIGHSGDGSSVLTKHTNPSMQTSDARAGIRETRPSQRDLSHAASFEGLQLLLSLDTALSLIHADREALKRVETFAAYPGHYGHRVQETIEEVFILMVQAMSSRHIVPGFAKATEQMKAYDPKEANDSEHVAPLMQFFELVHVGDMIQSMVQVYFDKEVARHIDRTDFLNGAVREKKLFENALDDSVASGLNAGTEVLMSQVEHIVQTLTGPREYYPVEGSTMDLQPTAGCREAIACLRTHCDLLKGSTTKEVLEVFHQEIGIRLDGIIQKHLKRQIISLEGGFQVIADLNAYHAFINSLRVPNIAADFANLKMLGHVYIVEDAKDLAQIVRDVTRYGGSFRPEDVYEFIQRRSDWKKIEKTVDKAMYNLSFKEDCTIS